MIDWIRAMPYLRRDEDVAAEHAHSLANHPQRVGPRTHVSLIESRPISPERMAEKEANKINYSVGTALPQHNPPAPGPIKRSELRSLLPPNHPEYEPPQPKQSTNSSNGSSKQ